MKLREILKNVEILSLTGNIDEEIKDITSDSRCVKEGTAFVCLKGYVVDGHKFAQNAIEKGACAIIVMDDIEIPKNCNMACNVTIVKVNDTRLAIALMADSFYHHPSGELQVIGVTGTKGKTTTTCMIKRVFDSMGVKTGLIGTMKNMVGDREIETDRTTPEALVIQKLMREMADCGVKVCIMEVSSQGLHLNRVAGIDFDICAFTNLSRDHIGQSEHTDMEDYANAKAKLFTMCKKGVFNIDNEYADVMKRNAKCEIFDISIEKDADFKAVNIVKHERGTEYDIIPGKIHINLPIPGTFSVYNSLEAYACCSLAGVEGEKILSALRNINVPGKAEIVESGSDFTIIIDYAHNPDSFENIIKTVKEFAKRTVFLFGCGGDRNRPRELMGKTAGTFADFAIITSDNPRSEDPESICRDLEKGIKLTDCPYELIVDRASAIEYALRHARPGDVIILAGKGHETYQILKDRTIHFDEREVVKDILGKMKNEGVLR